MMHCVTEDCMAEQAPDLAPVTELSDRGQTIAGTVGLRFVW